MTTCHICSRTLLALLLTLALASCGDDEKSTGGQDAGDDSGSPDVADQGQQDQGQQDQGQQDQGQQDQGQQDQGQPDQGQEDQAQDDATDVVTSDLYDDVVIVDLGDSLCSVDTSEVDFPDNYDDGEGGDRAVSIIIEAVDFTNDMFYIRNVTHLTGRAREIDFDDDWRIAYNTSGAALSSARNLPANGRMAIYLTGAGFNTSSETYLDLGGNAWNLTACGGEVAVQNRAGQSTEEWSNHPGNIEAFVRWGDRSTPGATSTFNDEAFDAGAWAKDYTDSESATQTCWGDGEGASWCAGASPTCAEQDNHQGIVLSGDSNVAEDWLSTSVADFADCP